MIDLSATQRAMQQSGLDGWLVWDFRNSNSVLGRLLGFSKKHLTRRVMLWIPAQGSPTLISSFIDAGQFAALPCSRQVYITYEELIARLRGVLSGTRRVAMEYVPGGQLPAVSVVDAGTVELVRSLGPEVVSSADLIQIAVAVWGREARLMHDEASCTVAGIKDEAFALIRAAHAAGRSIDERAVQQHILKRFAEEGLETNDEPIVAVNAHAGDPHYAPTETSSLPILPGDWVLIDLWARVPGEHNIFSDITWVGYCGSTVPEPIRRAFNAVKAARDAALDAAVRSWHEGRAVCGWELDDAAMSVLRAAGYAGWIRHRTGHSLSAGPLVHGAGMNLDNLETRDTRQMLPGIGFTIEPGVYGPEFGVRLEINVHVDPQTGPKVTSCVQREIVLVG